MKIIVVDKEPDLEMLVEQKFRKQISTKELFFLFAQDGAVALDMIQKDPDIEIVITDVNVPNLSGFDLLFQLQKLSRNLKSIILSPYGDLDSIRTAMNLGAYDFLTRPLNLDDFEATLIKTIAEIKRNKDAKVNEIRLIDIEKELDVAKSIQSSIIPHQFNPFPKNHNFEIFGTMLPARRIGGDFFDFFPMPNEKLGFSIADVSGKGIPAALFMTMSRGLLRSLGQKTPSTLECLTQLNELLTLENDSSMFVTAFYGILDINSGLINYCNAGHNPPYLIDAKGELRQIGRGEGIALGVTTELVTYEEHQLQMNPGEIFMLYTDGVTEAMNRHRELYQEHRLEDLLKQNHKKSLQEIIETLLKDVQEYSTGMVQTDDITILAIRYIGPK